MRATVLTAWLPVTCLLLCSLGCDGGVELEVTPSELNYGTIAGDAHIHLTIKNTGNSGIFWDEQDLLCTFDTSEGWIRVCADTLTVTAGDSYSCEIWIDRDELQPGKNTGWVYVLSDGGDADVRVTVSRNVDIE